MSTTFRILRGAGQIGGNITEIEGEKTRLILDFGIPLTEADGNSTNLRITDKNLGTYLPQITDTDKETIILLTHAHPDHFGLLRFLQNTVPVFATKTTKDLLQKTSELLYQNLYDNLNIFEINGTVKTGDFTITPFEVNHSVAGSCGYLITDRKSGKKIFYTGDFRFHGRENSTITDFLKDGIDYLITEGTTLSRKETENLSEYDVEEQMTKIFRENKMSIVCCSPLNTDRIISVYNACIKADKIFVIDPYSAFILENLSNDYAPKYDSKNIKVYCSPNRQSKIIFENEDNKIFGKNKILFKKIMENPEKYVIKDNFQTTKSILKRMKIKDINVIFSYWKGYLESDNYRWKKYEKEIKHIHCSGHITKTDLIDFVQKINPKKIIPVHTLAKDVFCECFGDRVVPAENMEVIEI